MIKNIIFDMGNVLIHFDRERFLDRQGVTGEDRELLMREVFLSLEWSRMDRGTLDEPEAVKSMCTRLPERLWNAADKLTAHWHEPILPMEGMAELVKELKELGYGIYLLSNASHMQHSYWPRIPGQEYFDGTVISSDILRVKPEAEIYEHLLEKFSLRREECVFIDDSTSNAEGAFFAGIPAIVFHGSAALLRKDLRRMGVMVKE